MRWFVLFTRSRQVPVSLVALLVSTGLLGWAVLAAGQRGGTLPVLILVSAVMAMSAGLSGQDSALDRTAAIRWPPRRAAHVVLIGVVSGAAFLAVRLLGSVGSVGTELAPLGLVALDCAGLAGLAALGATAFGGAMAWAVPFAWFLIAVFVPRSPDTAVLVVTWLLQPPGTPAATWTALVLGVAGTAVYAVSGPRR
ncbi:hypothetical protein [Amycolatopsis sp. H20-H5]|uniref:hypothetical protein n=1 Tax=Amycolatopsis sp. H20-H5 TaxID=3046309 RepID=UPI002DB704FA|nr:hypothetical protein [Amycolatopsis sp. H20-H5]MEC3975971.1 hypothetical protein [Amycolatopsis sp. H20-H5]